MPELTGASISLLGVMLPEFSKQQAVREGVGAGVPTWKVWKRCQHWVLAAPCHLWTVLIEINGLLSHSLGRLLREWILMGRGARVPGVTKLQASISGGREKHRQGALRKIFMEVGAQLALHRRHWPGESPSQLWTSCLSWLTSPFLSPVFRYESARETRKQSVPHVH